MKRAELVVAIAFVVAILAALGLFAVYIAGGQSQVEGALLFLALGGIGTGLLVWAARLMTHFEDRTQSRRHGPQPAAERETAAETMVGGVQEMRRRTFLFRLLAGAAAALGLAAIFPIRSLGRAPGASLFRTEWRKGSRVVDRVDHQTLDRHFDLHASPLRLFGFAPVIRTCTIRPTHAGSPGKFTTVFPEHAVGSADSQAVLIRVPLGALKLPPDPLAEAPEGYVAYSKICTHAGCALGLYLAAVQQLRCPCHQSTFDVLDGARPVYGPAPRPLPQLPIEIDPDGTIRALGDFSEPVGPSFWDLSSS